MLHEVWRVRHKQCEDDREEKEHVVFLYEGCDGPELGAEAAADEGEDGVFEVDVGVGGGEVGVEFFAALLIDFVAFGFVFKFWLGGWGWGMSLAQA